MPTAPFPSNALAEFFRFAVLLTGDARSAEKVLVDTLIEAEAQLEQLRKPKSRQAWFVTRIRERCLKNDESDPAPPHLPREEGGNGLLLEIAEIESAALAQRFHGLPEPERSALALFYLDFFTVEEIAQFLRMNAEVLSDTLGAARALLNHALRAGDVIVDPSR